jgi:hypothetical protein
MNRRQQVLKNGEYAGPGLRPAALYKQRQGSIRHNNDRSGEKILEFFEHPSQLRYINAVPPFF